MPLISVIIPSYGEDELRTRLVKALQDQTLPPKEIILVDNNVEPRICASKYNQPFILIHEPTPGSYAARNAGAKLATGEILAFTDADCIPAKNWLEEATNASYRHPRSVIGGRVLVNSSQEKNPTIAEIYDSYFGIQQEHYINNLNFSVTANLVVKRQDFKRVGPFNPALKSSGDREWCLRAAQAGFGSTYAPEAIVYHPARNSAAEILRKARRKVGGVHDLAALPSARLPIRQSGLMSLRRALAKLKTIGKTNGPFVAGQVLFLMLLILGTQSHEKVLLALGKASNRD